MLCQGRSLVARPGVPIVWSLGQPFDSLRTAGTRQQLYLPRDAFGDMAGLLDAAALTALDTPLGALLGDFMLSLQRRLPTIPAPDTRTLPVAIRALVAASLSHLAASDMADCTLVERSRLARLRKIVLGNLRAPQLGPAMLCRELAMSRSSLYRLLEPEGGVARFILRARLQMARRQLCDPAARRPIAQIAQDFCFSDASAFARAFRLEFGHSPKEARDADRVDTAARRRSPANDHARGGYAASLNL